MSHRRRHRRKLKSKDVMKVVLVTTAVALVAFVAVPVAMLIRDNATKGNDGTITAPQTEAKPVPSRPVVEGVPSVDGFAAREGDAIAVDNAITIEALGAYSGAFVENGKNEVRKDILAVMVTNHGTRDLHYAKFQLTAQGQTYDFELSNLPSGASALVMEKSARPYADLDYQRMGGVVSMYFPKSMEESMEQFKTSCTEGFIKLTNEGSDVNASFFVYYKNVDNGVYIGGITYRVEITGGLKAGEMRQLSAVHYSPEHSQIVMIG